PAIDRFPGLFAYLQQAFAYVTPPLVAVFAIGMTSRRIGAGVALKALLTGHAISAAWFVATQLGWVELHFTIVAGVLFVATILAAHGWQSTAGAHRAPRPEQLAAMHRTGKPLPSAATRRVALLLTLLTIGLVTAFR